MSTVELIAAVSAILGAGGVGALLRYFLDFLNASVIRALERQIERQARRIETLERQLIATARSHEE